MTVSKINDIKIVDKENGWAIMFEKQLASGKKTFDFYKEEGKTKIFDDEFSVNKAYYDMVDSQNKKKRVSLNRNVSS